MLDDTMTQALGNCRDGERKTEPLDHRRGHRVPRRLSFRIQRDHPVDFTGRQLVSGQQVEDTETERGGPIDQRVVEVDEQQGHVRQPPTTSQVTRWCRRTGRSRRRSRRR
ncbi:MAG: hypothetical protein J2P24_10215 [Streptosporangiales bacterium]|nr:hypothetical protein [Streptosporangiales bacterium]